MLGIRTNLTQASYVTLNLPNSDGYLVGRRENMIVTEIKAANNVLHSPQVDEKVDE